MRIRVRRAHAVCLAAAALLVAPPRLGHAAPTEVGGGGSKSTDCLTTFTAEVSIPVSNPRHVRCVDGTACDADATINGVCTLPVVVCANSTFSASCNKNGVADVIVDHALDNGEPKFDPDFQSLQNRIDNDLLGAPPNVTANDCTTASNIRVPIKGPLGANHCSRGKTKKVRLTTTSQLISGHMYTDVDTIKFQCDPNPAVNGCDPQTLFPGGTFDRIQKQVFNQNCAVSGCHDSQSYLQAGALLLETGASFTNLVEVDPVSIGALGAMWKRVDVITQDISGSPATSFLFHKVEGDLPDPVSYGLRMPRKRPKLHSTLRDVIEAWILNGAPASGWVPGTF